MRTATYDTRQFQTLALRVTFEPFVFVTAGMNAILHISLLTSERTFGSENPRVISETMNFVARKARISRHKFLVQIQRIAKLRRPEECHEMAACCDAPYGGVTWLISWLLQSSTVVMKATTQIHTPGNYDATSILTSTPRTCQVGAAHRATQATIDGNPWRTNREHTNSLKMGPHARSGRTHLRTSCNSESSWRCSRFETWA